MALGSVGGVTSARPTVTTPCAPEATVARERVVAIHACRRQQRRRMHSSGAAWSKLPKSHAEIKVGERVGAVCRHMSVKHCRFPNVVALSSRGFDIRGEPDLVEASVHTLSLGRPQQQPELTTTHIRHIN